MKKKTAGIIALCGTMYYLLIQIYLMLRYSKPDSISVLSNNALMSFFLQKLPLIIFLFTVAIYFITSISYESEMEKERAKRKARESQTNINRANETQFASSSDAKTTPSVDNKNVHEKKGKGK